MVNMTEGEQGPAKASAVSGHDTKITGKHPVGQSVVTICTVGDSIFKQDAYNRLSYYLIAWQFRFYPASGF